MDENNISGVLFTKHDELHFSNADAFANKEGNICVWLDDKSFAVLTPIMAKRLNKVLDEAVRSSLGMVLGEK
ncbi:MAG: hypothetical protein ACI8Q1_003661 [Parvicella sp.]|jgi:hypothetical protein